LRVWREGAAYGGVLDIAIDLRVDDHRTPVDELARLLDLHDLYFGKPDPATLLPLEGPLAAEVVAALNQLATPQVKPHSPKLSRPGQASKTTKNAWSQASSTQ
jgi:uncharacterized Ntn-hydrolase superfamily protein